VLAIIPARGGSKGVPRKNIRMLDGKPLIHWSIEAAMKADSIDRVILSTDDDEIAEVCKSTGIEIPFIRPKELAMDDSLAIDNYIYSMKRMCCEFDYKQDEFVVVLPTVPFRTSADIDAAVELFYKKQADSVISCTQLEHPLDWICNVDTNGKISRDSKTKTINLMNRQESKQGYIPNGAIYVMKQALITKNYSYYSDKTYAYIMPSERSIDIDTEYDFMQAEYQVEKMKGINK